MLEDWAVQMAALQETLTPRLVAARLLVFAADHGVTQSNSNVSAYPRGVSASIFRAIARGQAASATLCRANDCSLHVLDVGIDAPAAELKVAVDGKLSSSVLQCSTSTSVRRGSRDMLQGPAVSPEESLAAQAVGRAAVRRYLADMARAESELGKPSASTMALCVGELGIGNTTSAAAIVAALTGVAPAEVCGRGTGLDDEGVRRKVAVVERALDANAALVQSRDPSKILQGVGGLEIAAMAGAMLEAAAARLPVIVDGFVSGAAALVALRMEPGVARSLFWSHHSDEKGTRVLLDAVSAITGVRTQPALAMGLRLGEGTGAVLALPLLRSACAIMGMATLQEALQPEDRASAAAPPASDKGGDGRSNKEAKVLGGGRTARRTVK